MSKVKTFIATYLTSAGTSVMIRRYDLPAPWAYTSGDGIVRSESRLGREYKFCRFGATFNASRRISQSWRLCITPEESEMLEKEHSTLTFPDKPGVAVHFIKFYGPSPPVIPEGIRSDIVKAITALTCASCGTSPCIACDA